MPIKPPNLKCYKVLDLNFAGRVGRTSDRTHQKTRHEELSSVSRPEQQHEPTHHRYANEDVVPAGVPHKVQPHEHARAHGRERYEPHEDEDGGEGPVARVRVLARRRGPGAEHGERGVEAAAHRIVSRAFLREVLRRERLLAKRLIGGQECR